MNDRLGRQPGALAWAGLQNLGSFGVDVFFVISGFIIFRTTQSHPGATSWAFFRQRLIRVVPMYFLLSSPLIARDILANGIEWPKVIATFLFWPAIGDAMQMPYLSVGWTLCFEMLFYAGMALSLARRGAWKLLVLGFLGAFAVALMTGSTVAGFLGNPMILEFGAGVLLALAWGRGLKDRDYVGVVALVLSVSWLVLFTLFVRSDISMVTLRMHGQLVRVALWAPPAVALVFAAVQLERRVPQGRVTNLLVLLGNASYALYLVHRTLILALEKRIALIPIPADVAVLGVLALSSAVAVAVYLWVEKPLLAALNGFVRGQGLRRGLAARLQRANP